MSERSVSDDRKSSSEKRQRIIQAAIRVFAQKGFFHAKVADVAKEADVADGTIYLYFKNKDDLLLSIFETSMDAFIRDVKSEVAAEAEPFAKLKRFVTWHLDTVQRNQALAQVLQVELRSSTKFMKEYRPERFFSYLQVLEDILIEGQNAGVFRSDIRPDILRRAIFGALEEIAVEWILTHKKRYGLAEAGEQVALLLLSGLKSPVS